ncbi:MAG: AI-2E family transporter [Chthoniobacteraceae bacterium]
MIEPAASKLPVNREGWWTREHALIMVLVVATALLLILCGLLVKPFFGALAWALALAVVAHPLHRWIERRLSKKPGLAAGLAVLAVALVIVAPAVFVGTNVVKEATSGVQALQQGLKEEKWRETAQRSPQLAWALNALEQQGSLGEQAQGMAAGIGKQITRLLSGSAWAVVELLLTLFVLFYLFRDRAEALATLRSLVPLSARETTKVFTRVADTVQASVFGTLVVAAVQGLLGGLMFWWLGLPAPILWGSGHGAARHRAGARSVRHLGAGRSVSRGERPVGKSGHPHRLRRHRRLHDRQPPLPDPRRQKAPPAHRARLLFHPWGTGRLRRVRSDSRAGDPRAPRCHSGNLAAADHWWTPRGSGTRQ